MADLLVKHLKQKAGEHSALTSLISQWDFDQKLIPKALQTVGSLFSHYSRHDESHSKQILVNIERILGNNIGLLSATDTWLILEAAYWHDIGMVVPHADLAAAMKDPEFETFLRAYCDSPSHELHHIASALKRQRGANAVFDEVNPLEAVSRFKELMAEWFRRKHPERADQVVRTPMQSIGVNSPRTELIPSRLFRVLGRICLMHGVPFDDLMKEDGLPFREAGLAQDDCHPRFVACMLRMGDLLDMDDNRFCPVMQRIAGEGRASLSKAHEEKHSSIRHLRVDQERIEVSAECQSIDGYLETFKWFEWLKKELHDQMANWRDIVPDRALGLLPTLGQVTVDIGGNLQVLRDGERPAFGVDVSGAMKLLQGNNLYESRFACVREVLQNAVDATCLRLWLEHQKDPGVSWDSPFDPAVIALFKKHSVEFELVELDTSVGGRPNVASWLISVSDHGTGISKHDLEYMLKIGGSSRNSVRRGHIESMPEWLKPAGRFGIGLQSIFMLTDKIEISTKDIFTNESYSLILHSPTGEKQGLVILSSADNGFSIPYGTVVSFNIELPKFPNSFGVLLESNSSLADRLAESLDPVLNEDFPYEAARVYDAALKFGENSLVTIEGRFENRGVEYPTLQSVGGLSDAGPEHKWRFFRVGDFECRFDYEPSVHTRSRSDMSAYYRGQEFETRGLHFPNVDIWIDILSGSADSWVNFSRDKVAEHAVDKLRKSILDVLIEAVSLDLAVSAASDRHVAGGIPEFSIFLKSMALYYKGQWERISEGYGRAWLNLPIRNTDRTFNDYFKLPEWSAQVSRDDKVISDETNHLLLHGSGGDLLLTALISEWRSVPGRKVLIKGSPRIYEGHDNGLMTRSPREWASRFHTERNVLKNIIVFGSFPEDGWDSAALATELAGAAFSAWTNRRYWISSLGCSLDGLDLSNLVLREDVGIRASSIFDAGLFDRERVLLPYLFLRSRRGDGISISIEALDELCRWVKPRLVNNVALEAVRKSYCDLITYVDETVMSKTVYWGAWKSARGI